MSDIKLIALDLDGTLFDNNSQISQENIDTINKALSLGVEVVISTGRPFSGIPFQQLKKTKMNYAITTNGAAIYEISTGKCIFEAPLDNEISFPIIEYLLTKEIHMDAFINGKSYSPLKCLEVAQTLSVPESLKDYILNTRTRVEDLLKFVSENNFKIQKMTLNFHKNEKGELIDREEVKEYLLNNPLISVVNGGYNNLEFTLRGINKGVGLEKLANYLNVNKDDTMAIGDSENDLAIIKAAKIGVAMANADKIILDAADYTTLSNTESGVAAAIKHFIPSL